MCLVVRDGFCEGKRGRGGVEDESWRTIAKIESAVEVTASLKVDKDKVHRRPNIPDPSSHTDGTYCMSPTEETSSA